MAKNQKRKVRSMALIRRGGLFTFHLRKSKKENKLQITSKDN